MSIRFLLTAVFAVVFVTVFATVASMAQSSAVQQGHLGSGRLTPRPYTAEFKSTTVRTLANGTTITHTHTTVEALDSAGRYLQDINEGNDSAESSDSTESWHSAFIDDPVAHTRTAWDTRSKQVIVTTRPQEASAQTAACLSSNAGHASTRTEIAVSPLSRDQVTQEELGTKSIFGVQVRGVRTKRTTPVGVRGNDAPLVTITEVWTPTPTPQGFRRPLEEHIESDEAGTTVRELTSLSLAEPDSALFVPPAGYEVVQKDMHPIPCVQTVPRRVVSSAPPSQ
jgi:hypothetical protein